MNFLFFLLLSFAGARMPAGDSLPYRNITYRVQARTTSDSLLSGYLHLVKDSSIVISAQPAAYGKTATATSRELPYHRISRLEVKRKGRISRGLLFGAIAGTAAGAAIGAAAYEEPDCPNGFCFDLGKGAVATAGALIGIAGGALVGALIGTGSRQEFIIAGTLESFEQMKAVMQEKVRKKK